MASAEIQGLFKQLLVLFIATLSWWIKKVQNQVFILHVADWRSYYFYLLSSKLLVCTAVSSMSRGLGMLFKSMVGCQHFAPETSLSWRYSWSFSSVGESMEVPVVINLWVQYLPSVVQDSILLSISSVSPLHSHSNWSTYCVSSCVSFLCSFRLVPLSGRG